MRSSIPASTFLLAFTLSAFATATPLRSNTPRRPDLNAFVDHKVTDTQTLVAEVKNNPEVADRYARLFKMTPQEVVGYLSTLHPEHLANSAEYTVWSAPPGVPLKRHQQVLKKGTPVFADSEGRPMLIVRCGNPIGIPARPLANMRPIAPTSTEIERDLPETHDTETDASTLFDAAPIVPELAVPAEVGPADIVAMTSINPVASAGHFLPYLGLAPLLAPVFGSSSGDRGNIVIFPTPEPAPFAALALGAVAIVRRRRKA